MLIRSKHSGWLNDGTRTPYIFKAVGKFFADNDPSKSVSRTLAKVDPGPAIGKGLSEVDKFVNREIPGGWVTVGAVAAGGAAIYYAPQVLATAAATGTTPAAASSAMGIPGVVGTAAVGGPAGSTAASLGSLTWTAPVIGGKTAANAAAFGTLNAALPAAGATGFGSLSAALPAGAMFGTGLNGAAIGSSVLSAGPGQVALNAFGNPIQASSIGFGGFAPNSSVFSTQKLAELLDGMDSGESGERQGTMSEYFGIRPSSRSQNFFDFNKNAFGAQPTMTVVDPKDDVKKDSDDNLFGLADILRDYRKNG